jgi:hypothetical protein
MRRLTIAIAIAVMLVITACSTDSTSTGSTGATATGGSPPLAEQTQKVGEVDVKAQPVRMAADGAAITITLDTHSVTLDQNLPAKARLTVNGTTWPTSGWDGDPPEGHHRTGTLRFDPAGPATGAATLHIDGFAEPVTFSWQLEA